MTDTPTPSSSPAPTMAPKPPFDFGAQMSATFGTFFKKPVFFTGFIFLGMLIIFVIGGALSAAFFIPFIEALETSPDPDDELGSFFIGYGILIAVLGIGFAFLITVIVRAAVTVKLGEGVQFGTAMKRGLAGILPLIGMGLLLIIPFYIGYLLLIVPGLYLGAMFSLILPVVAFEGRGFGALGRSLELTRGYRWVLVGYNLVLGIVATLISYGFSFVAMLIIMPFVAMAAESDGSVVATIIASVIGGIIFVVGYAAVICVPYIGAAMAYVRLREIKEGGGDELLKVFE